MNYQEQELARKYLERHIGQRRTIGLCRIDLGDMVEGDNRGACMSLHLVDVKFGKRLGKLGCELGLVPSRLRGLGSIALGHLPHGRSLRNMAAPSSASLSRPAVKVLCHSNCSVRIVFNWDLNIEF